MFRGIHIGNSVSILTINGEVVSEYAIHLRNSVPREYLFLVGCVDDTIGYIPTAKILGEGGYEAGGYCMDFGLQGVSPMVEKNTLIGFDAVTTALRPQPAWMKPKEV